METNFSTDICRIYQYQTTSILIQWEPIHFELKMYRVKLWSRNSHRKFEKALVKNEYQYTQRVRDCFLGNALLPVKHKGKGSSLKRNTCTYVSNRTKFIISKRLCKIRHWNLVKQGLNLMGKLKFLNNELEI
jgi:hypothetical protein